MIYVYDDISVGILCFFFIGNCWLILWGEVVSNLLKVQWFVEEYWERQEVV